MPADDLGAPAYRKFDIETWIPSREDFGEISSTSNCLDYQSRRLNIRYKTPGGKNKLQILTSENKNKEKANKTKQNLTTQQQNFIENTEYVHTVNGTACAVPRLILTIMENNQTQDGKVKIPTVLVPWMGGLTHMTPKRKPK
jgi:seryl-tRNA synthetase